MWRCYFTMWGLNIFLVSCHGQTENTQNFLEALNKCVEGMKAMESQLNVVKEYHEKTFRRLESIHKDLEKAETKLWTKIESVEKELKTEMRDRSTTVEKNVREALTKVVNGQLVVTEWTDTMGKDLLEEMQMQMLELKDVLKQKLGVFADQLGNDQSEAIADRLRDEWTNFSRTLLTSGHGIQREMAEKVPDSLLSTTNAPDEPVPCNSDADVQDPLGCHHLRREGVTCDGTYLVHANGQKAPFFAYCDMSDSGGGWTVIMHRGDYGETQTRFDQNWNQYRKGFGNLEQEFWLGNEKIHALTSTGQFELRVTLTAFDGDVLRIDYERFRVDNEESGYRLRIGDADRPVEGSSLQQHDGHPFSTRDRNNDGPGEDCAAKFMCGWWFRQCYYALLTGPYFDEDEREPELGIRWQAWKGGATLKGVEMKIRPKDFK